MVKHDENKCLRSISRVAKIDFSNKTIQASKSAIIGIHMWGKIDYLTHYFRWHFYWNNSAGTGGYYKSSSDDAKKNYREMKKANKAPKLTDKSKKQSKKK